MEGALAEEELKDGSRVAAVEGEWPLRRAVKCIEVHERKSVCRMGKKKVIGCP